MVYYDQHVHTDFSFDSTEKLENYLKIAGDEFISTELVEFKRPNSELTNVSFDYTGYTTEIERLKKQTGKKIYKGVELGMAIGNGSQFRDYLSHHQFDLRLLSFHHNEYFDFMDDQVLQMNPIEVTEMYYQMMLKAINEFHEADVLAHFDYGVRRLNLTSGQFSTTAGVLLTKILQIAIENGMAFELNTASMYHYHNIGLYDYGLELYKQLGGKLYTIGSDAHGMTEYEDHFHDACDMLKAHDIHDVDFYQQGSHTKVAIDEII